VNASQSEPLRLYTVYAPPHHPDGTIHRTKADAEAAEAASR
jgi:mannose-6-phosphate isomerase-like protein (cupin superfamily)